MRHWIRVAGAAALAHGPPTPAPAVIVAPVGAGAAFNPQLNSLIRPVVPGAAVKIGAPAMPRQQNKRRAPIRIAVFADGTGNSAAKAFKTNIWRLYESLDLSADDQIAVFDDGVGTSSFQPFRLMGLGFGFGLKRKVLFLYKFLCRNYQEADQNQGLPADQIFGFGFSRGAFTIRVLMGFIDSQGLVDFESDEQLNYNAVLAYRAYRKAAYAERIAWWVTLARWLRDVTLDGVNYLLGRHSYEEIRIATAAAGRAKVQVHFLGLWDTVSAYGLPIEELTRAYDRWVWPLQFREQFLPGSVQCARQALSLDEERETFHPIPWDESRESPRNHGKVVDGKLLQVWFAGVHSNVGGGYPDDRLAHVSLCWMIGEAAKRGLRFSDWVVAGYAAIASDDARIYDSRAWLASIYRYLPRDAERLMNPSATSGRTVVPLVDASVILRIASGNDHYAPISLPASFDVLAPDGTAVTFDGQTGLTLPANIPDPLPVPAGQQRNLVARQEELGRAIVKLCNQTMAAIRAARVEPVLDWVWWRRVVYFSTVLLLTLLAAYPLLGGYLHSSLSDNADPTIAGWVAPFVKFMAGFAPGFVEPWLSAVALHSTWAFVLALVFWNLWRGNWYLEMRIHDVSRGSWNDAAMLGANELRRRLVRQAQVAAARGALLFGFVFVATFLSARSPSLLTPQANVPASVLVALGLLAVTSLLLMVFLGLRARSLRKQAAAIAAPAPASGVDDPTATVPDFGLARFMRTNKVVKRICELWIERIMPFAFFAGGTILILMFVNRAVFDLASSAGRYCDTTVAQPRIERIGAAGGDFNIKEACWASGLVLLEGKRYYIQLMLPDGLDWFDWNLHTDVEGYSVESWRQGVTYSATFFKRWWGQNWFKPIARIGVRGNDEYVLDPVVPFLDLPDEIRHGETVDGVSGWRLQPIDLSLAKAATAAHPRNGRRVLVAEITARTTGELFLYLNDAILVLPFTKTQPFYWNNLGTAQVMVWAHPEPQPPTPMPQHSALSEQGSGETVTRK